MSNSKFPMPLKYGFTVGTGDTIIYSTNMPLAEIEAMPELPNQHAFIQYFFDRHYWVLLYRIEKPPLVPEANSNTKSGEKFRRFMEESLNHALKEAVLARDGKLELMSEDELCKELDKEDGE